ncbi:MAG: hypothetical protein Q9200_001318 [Gallowayella weberi]
MSFSQTLSPQCFLGLYLANKASGVRHDLKSEDLTFTEIAKRVGEKWQTLSPEEREPFEAKAGSAKAGYLAELAQYKRTDHYRKHAQYLSDFKAKHSLGADLKKPRLGSWPNPGRNDGVGSRTDSPEPSPGDGVPQMFDHASSFNTVSHPRHPSSRSTTEGILSNLLSRSSPRPRHSPTTSASSLAPSGRTEKSSSPSVQLTPRQVAYPIASREHDPIKRPEPLPSITSLESRDPPLTRGSSFWFDNHLGPTFNNISPLSNYRRSYHPPASFVHQNSTSSCNSTSQSTDLSEASNVSTSLSEDSGPYRRPPVSTSGSKGPNPTAPADGLKPHGSIPVVVRTPPHHEPSLSSLSLKVGIASSRQSTRSSSRTPVGSHPVSPSQEAYSKPDEKKGIGLRGRVVEGTAPALD